MREWIWRAKAMFGRKRLSAESRNSSSITKWKCRPEGRGFRTERRGGKPA